MVKGITECHICYMGFTGKPELRAHYKREHPRSYAIQRTKAGKSRRISSRRR